MKYCVLIIDGAAGRPLPNQNMKTCLELANTPNLDKMAREGILGMIQTVPKGMEPSSACACMSIIGYDPKIYYGGRSGIEAVSIGFPIHDGEVGFRCNLVSIQDGRMKDYSAGHIDNTQAQSLIKAIQSELGSGDVTFYTGVGYRHLCKIKGKPETLDAICTPPHDIPNKLINEFLPKGSGSEFLLDLMERSKEILSVQPINKDRESRDELPANMIWLFWGSGKIPDLPPFSEAYSLDAAMTSGVDLLNGLAKMAKIDVLDIPGVTDGPDNNYIEQAVGALKALDDHDLVFIHVESPDEAGHAGNIDAKIKAIECIDREMVSQLLSYKNNEIRVLAMPDHPTPIEVRTHTPDPVPFLLHGPGFNKSNASVFSEAEANKMDFSIENGYEIMKMLVEV